MVVVKIVTFSLSFFLSRPRYTVWLYSRKKTRLSTLKITTEEKRKIGIFPKGLTNGFGKKLEISS